MFDTFEKTNDVKKRRLFCNDCGISTVHRPIASRKGLWSHPYEPINGGTTFTMFKCGGCETVCYLTSSWDSENYDLDEDGQYYPIETEKQFPPPLEKGFSFDRSHTPWELNALLDELVSGFLQTNFVSATLLIRVTIEYLAKDAKCAGQDLQAKIKDLLAKGLVDQDQHDLLQEIRKRGNKSAHEAIALSSDALRSGFEIISLLVDQLYNRPGRAAAAVKSAKRHFAPPVAPPPPPPPVPNPPTP